MVWQQRENDWKPKRRSGGYCGYFLIELIFSARVSGWNGLTT